jgi:hypothetical protein
MLELARMVARSTSLLMLTATAFVQIAHAEPFREITFNPPGAVGDFGNPANWSNPSAAPPVNPPLAPVANYGNTQYYIHNSKTAEINAGSSFGSHFSLYHIFPGDSPHFTPDLSATSGIPPSLGRLIMNGGPPPAPGQFGASLTVLGTNRLILGQRATAHVGGFPGHELDPSTGHGELIMNGASDVLADGIVVGERDRGYMLIGPDARVRSGRLNDEAILARQDFRIGSFGPSRGETEIPPVLLEGDGLVVVQGTLQAHALIMPESGATGELRLEGGTIDVRELRLDVQPGRASRSSKVSIVGSEGSFDLFAGDISAAHSSVTFSYTTDANGVVPVVTPAAAIIDTAKLELDLDALEFDAATKVTLIDAAPLFVFGEFSSVTFLGNTTATVNYDIDNGDIFLDNFVRTAVPLAGDFDEDFDVDGDDLADWRAGFGTTTGATHMQGDADDDNDVDGNDFLIWQRQLGSTSAVAEVQGVPEPSSAALGLLALAAWTRVYRRK